MHSAHFKRSAKWIFVAYGMFAIVGNFAKHPSIIDVFGREGMSEAFFIRLTTLGLLVLFTAAIAYSLKVKKSFRSILIPLVKGILVAYCALLAAYNVYALFAFIGQHDVSMATIMKIIGLLSLSSMTAVMLYAFNRERR